MELLNLFTLIRRYILFILCACALTASASIWYSVNGIKNEYAASCMIIIVTGISGGPNNTLNHEFYLYDAGLVNSYRAICKTNRILQAVLDRTGLSLTVSELSSKITVTSKSNTALISITAQDSNAHTAQTIANSVAEVFKDEIPGITKINNVRIVDYAGIPSTPTSQNREYIVLLSMLGCLSFCALVIAAREKLDLTVKSEQQLQAAAKCPVLSSLPHTRDNILF